MPLPPVQFLRGRIASPGGSNHADDVLWVQGLLNGWLKSINDDLLALDGGFGSGTQAALKKFQATVVSLAKPDGAVAPGDATALKLLSSRPAGRAKIVEGKDFWMQLDGAALDATLVQRVQRLAQCLIDSGVVAGDIKFNQGVRSPKVAHRWSTSWNIRKGRVPLAALTALKDGKDVDGNLWYDERWTDGLAKDRNGDLTPTGVKALWKKINANAWSYYQSDAIAAEGYRLSDARIKPNGHRAVSNHTGGRAVDVSIPWKAGARLFGLTVVNGETSDAAANRIVRAFDLSRPVNSERWHFQLPVDDTRGFVAKDNLRAASPRTSKGPQEN
jgi:hypothetical protein